MNIADFDIYKDLLKENSGLMLGQNKSYIVVSRLNHIAKKWGYNNISTMTNILRGVPSQELIRDVVEAMTTNETSFFRDKKPFEAFKDIVLPYYKKNPTPSKKLRIWCAAASSGQEPYSLAMTIKEEETKMPGWHFEIIATDISHEILDQAKEGIYSQFEVQRGLPITHLMKYFTQEDDKWTIHQSLRDMVKFRYFNLLDEMRKLGTFDVVFCQNVLIDFDPLTKKDVMERINEQIVDDGFFFLDGQDTASGATDVFTSVNNNSSLYTKADSQHTQLA